MLLCSKSLVVLLQMSTLYSALSCILQICLVKIESNISSQAPKFGYISLQFVVTVTLMSLLCPLNSVFGQFASNLVPLTDEMDISQGVVCKYIRTTVIAEDVLLQARGDMVFVCISFLMLLPMMIHVGLLLSLQHFQIFAMVTNGAIFLLF